MTAVTLWSEWSDCSVTNGGLVRKRASTGTNPIPGQDERNCEKLSLPPANETKECSPVQCPITSS